MISAYITSVHPLLIDDKIIWDLMYITEDSTERKCIRIYNQKLSFLIARFPGMRDDQFKNMILRHTATERNINISYRTDLAEATHFQFGNNRMYAEIWSKNPNQLRTIYGRLYKEASEWYSLILTGSIKISAYDNIFMKNTETPFRFTNSTTNISRSIYTLSTKHCIPLIGGVKLDIEKFVDHYPASLQPRMMNIIGLDMSVYPDDYLINNIIIPDDTIDLRSNMTMVAYDIETYNKNMDLSPIPDNNYIFSIGIGVFNLSSSIPLKRYCLITKPIHPEENNESGQLEIERYTENSHLHIKVKHEYSIDVDNDETIYIICRNEHDILVTYIKLISSINPHMICGFNSFGFDDNYIYVRCEQKGIEQALLQVYTPYQIDHLRKFPSWANILIPKHTTIDLKFDGMVHKNEFKTIKSTFMVMIDVHKLMIKEDPKRFTQHGRGRLDDMLLHYRTVNPFTKQQLSKTGLSISDMYHRWDNNIQIYSIAKYCCQDAWICGTLIMDRGKLTDSIQMALISRTQFSDSIYRADGIRVSTTMRAYAYKNGFALMDEASKSRDSKSRISPIGGLVFDKRTVIGGAVRNLHPGKHQFVVALDYNSMYPGQFESCNIDASTIVDKDVITNPSAYNLEIVNTKTVTDMYGTRRIYYLRNSS